MKNSQNLAWLAVWKSCCGNYYIHIVFRTQNMKRDLKNNDRIEVTKHRHVLICTHSFVLWRGNIIGEAKAISEEMFPRRRKSWVHKSQRLNWWRAAPEPQRNELIKSSEIKRKLGNVTHYIYNIQNSATSLCKKGSTWENGIFYVDVPSPITYTHRHIKMSLIWQ